MKAVRTYLDWNASAPLRREARAAMVAALDLTGNPSSVHAEGRRARALVEAARERVAALVGARPAEVIFTSGATEANNWVLGAGWDIIFVSDIEHDSVLAPARASGARIVRIPVSHQGMAQTEVVAGGVPGHSGGRGRALVSLQMANNETGVIQPVAATAALAREHGVLVHTDAVQAAGRVPVDFAALGVDLLSLSSHKLGGPKGVGALVVREGTEIPAFVTGGGQERRRRAGTENVAAIAGFGAAASAALADVKEAQRVAAQRDHLERSLAAPDTGGGDHRAVGGAPAEYDVRSLAGQGGRDAGYQARSCRHRCERRGGVLVRQGRTESCAGRNGSAGRHCAQRSQDKHRTHDQCA